jgi:ElaA protein
METIVKRFDELTLYELYDLLKLRAQVFVVEQNCPYQDLDDIDKDAYHVFIVDEGEIVACARVIDKGKRLDEVSIGRVISARRRQGLGTTVMKASIHTAKEKDSAKKIKIGAQEYAIPFYQQVGFKVVSDTYLEDGIPHKYMIYEE